MPYFPVEVKTPANFVLLIILNVNYRKEFGFEGP